MLMESACKEKFTSLTRLSTLPLNMANDVLREEEKKYFFFIFFYFFGFVKVFYGCFNFLQMINFLKICKISLLN